MLPAIYDFSRSCLRYVIDTYVLLLNHSHAMSGNGGRSSRTRRTVQRRLGLRIRKLRRAKRLSREALAELMGVAPHNLKKWELGVHSLPINELVRLLEVLDVTFEELVLGHQVPPLPAGQRNELAVSLNRLVRAAKPLLQSPERKQEEE